MSRSSGQNLSKHGETLHRKAMIRRAACETLESRRFAGNTVLPTPSGLMGPLAFTNAVNAAAAPASRESSASSSGHHVGATNARASASSPAKESERVNASRRLSSVTWQPARESNQETGLEWLTSRDEESRSRQSDGSGSFLTQADEWKTNFNGFIAPRRPYKNVEPEWLTARQEGVSNAQNHSRGERANVNSPGLPPPSLPVNAGTGLRRINYVDGSPYSTSDGPVSASPIAVGGGNSTVWFGRIMIPDTGTYRFRLISSELSSSVMGFVQIDGSSSRNNSVSLQAGSIHDVSLSMMTLGTQTGAGTVHFQWSKNGGSFQDIPTTQLYVPADAQGTGLTPEYGIVDGEQSTTPTAMVGQIQPRYTGNYIIQATGDATAYVDDREAAGGLYLRAGQKYDVKVALVPYGDWSGVTLIWSSETQPTEIVPVSQLFAPSGFTPQVDGPDAADPDGSYLLDLGVDGNRDAIDHWEIDWGDDTGVSTYPGTALTAFHVYPGNAATRYLEAVAIGKDGRRHTTTLAQQRVAASNPDSQARPAEMWQPVASTYVPTNSTSGRFLVAARGGTGSAPTLNVTAFQTDGLLDTTYGTNGSVILPIVGLVADVKFATDGSFYLLTSLERSAPPPEESADPYIRATVSRYLATGLIDATFGNDGSATRTILNANWDSPGPKLVYEAGVVPAGGATPVFVTMPYSSSMPLEGELGGLEGEWPGLMEENFRIGILSATGQWANSDYVLPPGLGSVPNVILYTNYQSAGALLVGDTMSGNGVLVTATGSTSWVPPYIGSNLSIGISSQVYVARDADSGFLAVQLENGVPKLSRFLTQGSYASGTTVADTAFKTEVGDTLLERTGVSSILSLSRLSDGKILLVTTISGTGTEGGLAIFRYNADGTLDESWGIDGVVYRVLSGQDQLTVKPDGGIWATSRDEEEGVLFTQEIGVRRGIQTVAHSGEDPAIGVVSEGSPTTLQVNYAIPTQSEGDPREFEATLEVFGPGDLNYHTLDLSADKLTPGLHTASIAGLAAGSYYSFRLRLVKDGFVEYRNAFGKTGDSGTTVMPVSPSAVSVNETSSTEVSVGFTWNPATYAATATGFTVEVVWYSSSNAQLLANVGPESQSVSIAPAQFTSNHHYSISINRPVNKDQVMLRFAAGSNKTAWVPASTAKNGSIMVNPTIDSTISTANGTATLVFTKPFSGYVLGITAENQIVPLDTISVPVGSWSRSIAAINSSVTALVIFDGIRYSRHLKIREGHSAPSMPSRVKTYGLDQSFQPIKLVWEPDANAEYYQIYRRLPTTSSSSWELVATTTADSNFYQGEAPNSGYQYKVRAINASGNSAWSEYAGATYGSASPYGFNINGAVLGWSQSDPITTGFLLQQSTDPSFKPSETFEYGIASSERWFVLPNSNYKPSTTYFFRISALSGNEGRSEYTYLDSPHVVELANLSIQNTTSNSATISWTPGSPNTKIIIERRRKPLDTFDKVFSLGDTSSSAIWRQTTSYSPTRMVEDFTPVATVSADVGAFVDSGLDAGVVYDYRSRAVYTDAYGNRTYPSTGVHLSAEPGGFNHSDDWMHAYATTVPSGAPTLSASFLYMKDNPIAVYKVQWNYNSQLNPISLEMRWGSGDTWTEGSFTPFLPSPIWDYSGTYESAAGLPTSAMFLFSVPWVGDPSVGTPSGFQFPQIRARWKINGKASSYSNIITFEKYYGPSQQYSINDGPYILSGGGSFDRSEASQQPVLYNIQIESKANTPSYNVSLENIGTIPQNAISNLPISVQVPMEVYETEDNGIVYYDSYGSASYPVTFQDDQVAEENEWVFMSPFVSADGAYGSQYRPFDAGTPIVTFDDDWVDLDADSDNNETYGMSRSSSEDAAENIPGSTGAIISVNDGDRDGNGIPGYADRGVAVQTSQGRGGQLFLDAAPGIDRQLAKVRFSYSLSDPNAVLPPSPSNPNYALPQNGNLRVWAGINLVTPGLSYSLSSFLGRLDLYVEAVKASGAAGDIVLTVEIDPLGNGNWRLSDTVRYTAVSSEVSVDNNRDGKIKFDGSDQTSSSKPFLFWLNNNRDVWGGDSYRAALSAVATPRNVPDSVTPKIGLGGAGLGEASSQYPKMREVAERDMEDFAQLALQWSTTLDEYATSARIRLVNQTNSGMKLRVFLGGLTEIAPSYEELDATSHVTNSQTISKILSRSNWSGGVGTDPYAMPGQIMASGSTSLEWSLSGAGIDPALDAPMYHATRGDHSGNRTLSLIFEGINSGKGQVVFELLKDGKVISSSELSLELAPIKDMYDHYTVAYGPTVSASTKAFAAADPFSLPSGTPIVPTTPKQEWKNEYRSRFQSLSKDYFVFVHGWRLTQEERISFAESSYKRMFWEGYKGQFAVFTWPTQITDNPVGDPGNFDRSEFVAWNSAAGLNAMLKSIRSDNYIPAEVNGGKLSVMAHSMGNIVLSEALYLNQGSGKLVTNAIMSQAALSANYFSGDATLPDMYNATAAPSWKAHTNFGVAPFVTYTAPSFPAEGAIGGSKARFQFLLGTSAGTIYNYFNPDDYALASWRVNQAMKPLGSHAQGGLVVVGPFALSASQAINKGNVVFGTEGSSAFVNANLHPGYSDTTYEYDPVSGGIVRIKWDYRLFSSPGDGTDGSWVKVGTPVPVTFVSTQATSLTNQYEMFAFGASSIVAPLGHINAATRLPAVFTKERDLSLLPSAGGQSSKFSPLNTGHSAQFVGSMDNVKDYWSQLMIDIGAKS